jgi:hypothetical protein
MEGCGGIEGIFSVGTAVGHRRCEAAPRLCCSAQRVVTL